MRAFIVVAGLFPALALAQVPPRIGYQGRLVKADGTPEGGVVAMTFAVFPAAAGGTSVWSEDHKVAMTDGFYSLFLGDVKPFGGALFDGTDRYLEISTNGVALTPRQRIGSVPYALAAQHLVGGKVDAASISVGGKPVIDNNGKLVGTAAYTAPAGSGLTIDPKNAISLIATCKKDEVLKFNGTDWACGSGEGKTYTAAAGSGLTISPTNAVSLLSTCPKDQVLKWNGTAWGCAADADTTYNAGPGVYIDTNRAIGLSNACTKDQLLKYSGTTWACAADANNEFTAGPGLTVSSSNVVSLLSCAKDQVLKWNGSTWACAADVDTDTKYISGAGIVISPTNVVSLLSGCGPGELLKWNGVAWTCSPDSDTTYTEGAGIAISPTKVVSLLSTCTKDQVLKWSGTTWACAADVDTDTKYTGGSGINISSTNVIGLVTTCSDGQVLKYNGTVWACAADANTTYTGGPGINITSNTIALLPGCSLGQIPSWSGTAWTCTDVTSTPSLQAVAIANLIKNGDMEIWNATSTVNIHWKDYGAAVTRSISKVAGYFNASAIRVYDGDLSDAAAIQQDIYTTAPPSLGGTRVTLSVWSKWSAGVAAGKICIADKGADEAESSITCTPLTSAPSSTAWAKTAVTHVVSATPAYLKVILHPTTTGGEGGSYLFDGAMLVIGTYQGNFSPNITEQVYAGGITAAQLAGVAILAPLIGNGTPGAPLGLAAANTTTSGHLSSADWTTFNNKVTSVGTSAPLSATSGTTPVVSLTGCSAAGQDLRWNGTAWACSPRVTSVAATLPLLSSAGETPTLSMPAANGTTDGHLTAVNWTTFNTVTSKVASVSANGPLSSSGGTTPTLTLTGCAAGEIYRWSGTAWACSVNVKDVKVNAPLSTTGGETPTIALSQANATTDGFVTKADWDTFNKKVSSVGATGPLSSTGGVTPTLSMPAANVSTSGHLTSTDWDTFNKKVSSVAATPPLLSTGGTTPTLSLPAANASTSGHITSTDWDTFNKKVSSVSAGNSTVIVGGTATSPTVVTNPAVVQARVTGACAVGSAVTSIAADGSVTCAQATPQRVFRYALFNTYNEAETSWFMGNSAAMFGGVNPSNWTDNNALARDLQNDAEVLRTIFNRKMYPGDNALVNAERWSDQSSTNGRVQLVLIRVRNSTGSPVAWPISIYYTAYSGWGEQASIALNGVNQWNTGSSGSTTQTLSIPANKISTVVVHSTDSTPWQPSYNYLRAAYLGFYNNCLKLPTGLSYVDDLDSLSGTVW